MRKKETAAGWPWWVYAIPAVLFVLIGGGVGVFLMTGSSVPAPSPSPKSVVAEIPAPAPKKSISFVAKAESPRVKWIVRQENGPDENPPAPTGAGFNVEDVADATNPPVAIDVALIDFPEPAKSPDPKPGMNKEGLPWITFGRGRGEFGIYSTRHAPMAAANKNLTFDRNGGTNSTVLRVDNVFLPLDSPQVQVVKNEDQTSPDGILIGSERVYAIGGIELTERINVVNGNPVDTPEGSRRFLDTVQVRYHFASKDKKSHKVGLRMQVDTLIGRNDGVPFTVSGRSGVVNSFADFRSRDIPQFVQALETGDLKNPGTVAHITVKPGDGIETAERVLLTHWPGGSDAWEIPLVPLSGDSAIVFYWFEKTIGPAQSREVGFEYGLGAITSAEGKLGINLAGRFDVKEYFTVTAYVQNPVAKQTLTLHLPPGLEKLEGAMTQPVPFVGGKQATTTVTWKVQIKEKGDFEIKVTSNNGLEQTKRLTVGGRQGAGPLALEAIGPFEQGKPFVLRATVPDAGADPLATLVLPGALATADKLEVPVVGEMAEWRVVARDRGTYPVAVTTNKGGRVAKQLVIETTKPDGPRMTVEITPAAGDRAFDVVARVVEPAAGQKLTLRLPKDVKLSEGEMTVDVLMPAEGETATTIKWPVVVSANGRHEIAVESSVGPGVKKALTVDRKSKSLGVFTLAFEGAIEPGKAFDLVADIAEPEKGQTLTIELPSGLELIGGEAKQTAPAILFGFDNATSKVRWPVRAIRAGRYPVRVASSTGIARTRVLSIEGK